MPPKLIPETDIEDAIKYLRSRAFKPKKGHAPILYHEEVEIVLEMLQSGQFQEWRRAMEIVLP